MALVKTFNAYELQDEFSKMDRDYFTHYGYQALLDLFEECDCGHNTDLDVVAICCEFTEDSPENIAENYSNLEEVYDLINADGTVDAYRLEEFLNEHTWAMLLDNGNIIYQDF